MGTWLVTGGAGFIGTNLVLRLSDLQQRVVVIDDLSRPGSTLNAERFRDREGIVLVNGDVADSHLMTFLGKQYPEVRSIIHLAGQVSLLGSIDEPIDDFRRNALASLVLLETQRAFWPTSRSIFASTNKVYGDLNSVPIEECPTRYRPSDGRLAFGTDLPILLQGGYSCSKGCADAYFRDYATTYDLDTLTLRQSAVCGAFQNASADQGWASFLTKEVISGRCVQLNGVGKQVRDLLDVDDLVDLYLMAMAASTLVSRCYNVGGGSGREISLLEFFSELSRRGESPEFRFGPFRPHDQMYFVADTEPLYVELGWSPRYELPQIIDRLVEYERAVQ